MHKKAVCSVPVAPVYRNPEFSSELINQVLFGENLQILETEKQWIKIQTIADEYQGWVLKSQVLEVNNNSNNSDKKWLTSNPLTVLQFENHTMLVPFGSELYGYDEIRGIIGNNEYTCNNALLIRPNNLVDRAQLVRWALQWQNVPYLWGGKTMLGVDCSGFVQVLYKMLGVSLFRDAYQQASQGGVVDFLQEARCGDLAFFDDEEGKIIHVGMLLNNHQIIHAGGKVRIDIIDNAGILNSETGQRTHHLRIVKQYF